jgi:hypothetical protein
MKNTTTHLSPIRLNHVLGDVSDHRNTSVHEALTGEIRNTLVSTKDYNLELVTEVALDNGAITSKVYYKVKFIKSGLTHSSRHPDHVECFINNAMLAIKNLTFVTIQIVDFELAPDAFENNILKLFDIEITDAKSIGSLKFTGYINILQLDKLNHINGINVISTTDNYAVWNSGKTGAKDYISLLIEECESDASHSSEIKTDDIKNTLNSVYNETDVDLEFFKLAN